MCEAARCGLPEPRHSLPVAQLGERIWECSNKVLLRRSDLHPRGRHAGWGASAAINSSYTRGNKRASSEPHARCPLSLAIRSWRTSIAT